MPLYEYRCAECDEKFEKLVRSSLSEAIEIHCPKCGSKSVSRLVSMFGSVGLSGASSGGGCSTTFSGG